MGRPSPRQLPRRARWTLLCSSILLLAACATGAPPRSVEVSIPPGFDSLTAAAAAESGVFDRWWLLYQDPALDTLVERALQRGFSVREARARLEESRALQRASLAQFDPKASLQGSAELRDARALGDSGGPQAAALATAGQTRSFGVSLPVSWEIDFFGRRDAVQRAADADLAAARFDVESARAAIAADVARTLFQTRGLAVQREESIETVRIQRELMRVVGERARRGLTARSEIDRVAADVAQAEAQAAGPGRRAARARRALLVLTGRRRRRARRRRGRRAARCRAAGSGEHARRTCCHAGPTCARQPRGCAGRLPMCGSPSSISSRASRSTPASV